MFREWNCDDPEPPLETGVDEERTGSWVHSSNVLSVLDISKSPLGATFVPMLVILVLTEERNSVLGFIWIKLGHVQVINELEELELAERGVCLTSLLFEHRLKLELEEC